MKHIRMIAPSYRISEDSVTFTRQYFEALGMKVTVPPNLLGEDLLCAHRDDVRQLHLKEALTDESVDIIWLLMGGYGLTRLIPSLFSLKKPQKEKLFIGFSDGTALHLFLNQIWKWPSLHGPGARQIARQTVGVVTRETTLRLVKEGLDSYRAPVLAPFNEEAKALPSLSGEVVGGNLCLLQSSLGTKWQIKAAGKILFLEDVHERGYRIDRMLTHLQQAGIFENIKALILGDFTEGEEPNGPSLIPAVLRRFAKDISVPVFRLPGCGHGDENIPLPFNIGLTFLVEHS